MEKKKEKKKKIQQQLSRVTDGLIATLSLLKKSRVHLLSAST